MTPERGNVKLASANVSLRAETQLRDQVRRKEPNGAFAPCLTTCFFRGIRHKPTAPSRSHGSLPDCRVPVTGQLPRQTAPAHEHTTGGADE